MHTESNHWRGCRWRPYSNCSEGYSQIIGRISPIPPPPPRVSAPLGATYAPTPLDVTHQQQLTRPYQALNEALIKRCKINENDRLNTQLPIILCGDFDGVENPIQNRLLAKKTATHRNQRSLVYKLNFATFRNHTKSFSKLWSANFPYFLNARVFKILRFSKFLMIIRK